MGVIGKLIRSISRQRKSRDDQRGSRFLKFHGVNTYRSFLCWQRTDSEHHPSQLRSLREKGISRRVEQTTVLHCKTFGNKKLKQHDSAAQLFCRQNKEGLDRRFQLTEKLNHNSYTPNFLPFVGPRNSRRRRRNVSPS